MELKNVSLSTQSSSLRTCYPFSSVWVYRSDLIKACIMASFVEGIILVPITIANFLVIAGICRTRSLHSPANFLICALAFSDFGVGILALPFHLASNAFLLGDDFGGWCLSTRIAYGLGVLLAAVSLVTIAAVSIERTVALYMALRYEMIATNAKVIIFTTLTWIAMALVSVVQFVDLFSYQLTAAFITFVCFTISSYCCLKIYYVIRHHRTQITIQEYASEYQSTTNPNDNEKSNSAVQKKKSSTSLLCLYGLFLLCYSPYIGVQLALILSVDNSHVHAAEITTVSIVFINSVLNPILYCWRMRDIRRAMISVLPSCLKRNRIENNCSAGRSVTRASVNTKNMLQKS
ncbi:melanocyte-stimulating hormone receptor-like [Actinia tenebrosa]|uniref:Melanocyte-stimulating hormone receptor-like n=1 Tax=Actinia tenebrosa TaxID=6105 RepID=A0A6P8HH34_ACTTE|nr:melanocyte-stimulating hormone receptor-like [Actinia tenebrosa]